jgi:hypothetical protein
MFNPAPKEVTTENDRQRPGPWRLFEFRNIWLNCLPWCCSTISLAELYALSHTLKTKQEIYYTGSIATYYLELQWAIRKMSLITAPEAEFLDEIQTNILRVFLLAIYSQLYRFALRFLFPQTHSTSYIFLKTRDTYF